MGVEKVLVSKVILLVALWSPVDLYVFTEPKFETEKDCVEYVICLLYTSDAADE